METVKIKKETFDKIAAYKNENPDCKNLDDALGLMLNNLENDVNIWKEESKKFQNGQHDLHRQIEAKQKEINSLIEQGTNGTAEQRERIDELEKQVEDFAEEIKLKDAAFTELQGKLKDAEAGQNDNGVIAQKSQQQIDDLEKKLTTANKEIERLQQSRPEATTNENSIALFPETAKLLNLVAERLSERSGKTITGSQIMNMIFLRYNVERWMQWFYPLEIISMKEIEQVTGRTEKELKQFFNK